MEKKNLSKKLQVLLEEEDEKALYLILTRKAFENGTRPPPMSSYIRDIIKDHIKLETKRQLSYAEEQAKRIINEYNKQKNNKI